MELMRVIFSLPRVQKRILSVIIDVVFIITAFFGAIAVRLDNFEVLFDAHYWLFMAFVCPVCIFIFAKLGLYRAVLRYIGLQALTAIVSGVLISTFTIGFMAYYSGLSLPRTVPIIYAAFAFVFIGGSRTMVRAVFGSGIKRVGEHVIIYGAGVSGRQLATSLAQSSEFRTMAFVDDDPTSHGTVIQGVNVHSPSIIRKLVQQYGANKILLAMPSVSHSRRKQILLSLEPLAVQVLTIPATCDLVSGNKVYSDVKQVEIEDLLGRDTVAPREPLMAANIKGKNVMITGAGGSIGSELCRQILNYSPKRLVLYELSEYGLYSIENELRTQADMLGIEVEILPVQGSVQKENRVLAVMESFKVQTVYHTAAYKHVPLVEQNVVEGVRNNIFGTFYIARAAITAKVETFVLISTDKAVRPTNVMGATKRMAELVLQALDKETHSTRFCMVRFGNVLGSSGSVVPLFRSQIASGGPITVTHPEITRYFMTIPEASQLVIQAGAMGEGGDVFVLDMGAPVKIVDLAYKMVHLSGFKVINDRNLDGDIAIQFSGMRPGEKLYEELLIGDDVSGTEHERIMTAHEMMLSWEMLEPILDNLDLACHNFDHQTIRDILLRAPIGFNPSDGICDLVWLKRNKDKVPLPDTKVVPFSSRTS
jgi:FlaA1/EpsC-like NDP-sugar epimerase